MGGPHIPPKLRTMMDDYAYRRVHEPVRFDEPTGRWEVLRYADGLRVISDSEVFSNDLTEFIPDNEELRAFRKGNFQAMDEPRHRELRGLVSQGFTPKFVQSLVPRVEQVAAELLDAMLERGRRRVDIVAELAAALPVIVIAEVVGLPVSDRHLFRKWADALLVDNGVDALFSEEGVAAMAPFIREMNEYLLSHVDSYRRSGQEGLIRDLLDAELDGRRLDDYEIIGFLALLLIAGHLTTSTVLTNALLCLDENPNLIKQLRAEPALLGPAIEEVMRYRSPLVWVDRRALTDVELGGVRIPKGSLVSASLISTMRDEAEFAEPDVFDIHRKQARHLAFGKGIHFCLGAPLARQEVRIALTGMLERLEDFRVAEDEEIVFHDPKDFNGAKKLPMDLVPR
ncbi:cytochrome P450 [Nocardia sp. CDC159]|uniref:Cytochrome P450 n=1 Tax=Nocardia pulmonis TaxID=2951408 RepID=A0A9X2IWG7_9NOCA|nr:MULTISPECIES: cytochrome P450 [Nocardia]MCM6771866.1 cytochrome P450 [Nocardia pulmonis]MCM6785476.1 cytochrome P450 [Nocardia sp. CDC159]